MHWHYYCTFTTRYPMSLKSARRAMERLYSFISGKNGKSRVFWVAEPFDSMYGYHTHALVHMEEEGGKNSESRLRKAWQIVSNGGGGKENNHTVIKPYDGKLGANFYVTKYMLKPNADYDLSY